MWTQAREDIIGGPEELRFVSFDKAHAIGRDDLTRPRDAGISLTLARPAIALDPTDSVVPRGGEPISLRDQAVCYLRAARRGHPVGTTVGLANLPIALSAGGPRLDVEILGERWGASVGEAPLHDPEGGRMRG